MSLPAKITNGRQILERLSREGSQGAAEVAVVTSPGARAAAWAVKVKSLLSYNVYNVIAVVIRNAGTAPSEIGGQMQAVNLAESFTQPGTLPAGTYVVMNRVGDKNVFYAKP
jgi:alcohol dehydrogenase class IV